MILNISENIYKAFLRHDRMTESVLLSTTTYCQWFMLYLHTEFSGIFPK